MKKPVLLSLAALCLLLGGCGLLDREYRKLEPHSYSYREEADEDGCVTVTSGFVHPSVGMVYLYIDPSPEYSGYDSESTTFFINCCGLYSNGGSPAQLTPWVYDTFKVTSKI